MDFVRIFGQWADFLLWLTLIRTVTQIVMQIGGIFFDTYAHDLDVWPFWDTKVWGFGYRRNPVNGMGWYSVLGGRQMPTDYAWIDFFLEALNLALQLVAYPLLHLGITDGYTKWKIMQADNEA